MKAADIMTTPVVTVSPDTSVREAAALLVTRSISALPVIDGQRLVGIVSEGDLIHRHEIGTDCALRGDPWWLRIFRPPSTTEDYVKSHAARVKDIMSKEVATVGPDAPLWEVAELLDTRRVKRVPVLDAGRVAGIVSRSDLVRALAAAEPPAVPQGDEEIRAALLAELERQAWWRRGFCAVTVKDGVVAYDGVIQLDGEKTAARVAAESIPGVRGVEDHRLAFADIPTMV
jgi:CBS domain-containing protein